MVVRRSPPSDTALDHDEFVVPGIGDDPEWVIREDRSAERQRVNETLFTIASGAVGTRGATEEETPGSTPLVLAAGVYDGVGAEQHLLAAPNWTNLDLSSSPTSDQQILDLRTGLLIRTGIDGMHRPFCTARFASVTAPGAFLLRAEADETLLEPGPCLGIQDANRATVVTRGVGISVAVAAAQRSRTLDRRRTVERLAGYATGTRDDLAARQAETLLDALRDAGFDRTLAAQRTAWAQRWRDVDIRIPNDPAAQLAVRFALFHLWSHTTTSPEIALGARGVTGAGYSGHVFWDSDVFVLPAMATIDPHTADAIVRYRLHRLPAARRRAREQGLRGARFPWESAVSGDDVTPAWGMLGETSVPILTGSLEEHITADVAWAADFAAGWAGRSLRATSPEADLLTESARYWASRCTVDGYGRAHINHVIGPDEYHEDVSDNTYTNVMARWNLRRAAELLEGDGEANAWRSLAERLVDGFDRSTGRYEQFRGYFDLESLTMRDIAEPPVAADLLLGTERIARSQIIKQPDVLMLHHVVPDEVSGESLRPNLDFYLPRTAHGSSLSPSISAALLARAGRPDEALELFRRAATLDLQDRTGMTAAGLHMANIGGIWQCVVFGFAGVRVHRGVLHVDPRLPDAWPELEVRFRSLGCRIRLQIDTREIRVEADRSLTVRLCGQPVQQIAPGGALSGPREAG